MLLTESMMKEEGVINPSKRTFGQGKSVMTIQADQGDFVKVIADTPFISRYRPGKQASYFGPKGSRPMHQTTFATSSQPFTDYSTTNQTLTFGGRALSPSEVARPYPSQHLSQIELQHQGALDDWRTNNHYEFINKGADAPLKLHMPSIKNGLTMREGQAMKQILKLPDGTPSYRTQYRRIHDHLGTLRGPGVSHQRSGRKHTNILTGEQWGSAWADQNRRVSGNRILYHEFRRNTSGNNFAVN